MGSSDRKTAPRGRRSGVRNAQGRGGGTVAIARGRRSELVDGTRLDVPAFGAEHAAVVFRLFERLAEACRQTAIVSVQDPVFLSGRSEPVPDLALLRPRADHYGKRKPKAEDVLVLIEVVDAASTRARDVKLPLYARHGIAETWLVDVAARRLTMHAEPRGGRYVCVETPLALDEVRSPELEGVRVDLSGLF